MLNSRVTSSDLDFLDRFIKCEIDPSEFSHVAHLRLAWINISLHGVKKAEESIQKQIKKYVSFLGAEDKYNTTLTVAATKAVYHFMLKAKSDNFIDFVEEFPQLEKDFKSLLDTHYSFNIVQSDIAKNKFLEPDLAPFDPV